MLTERTERRQRPPARFPDTIQVLSRNLFMKNVFADTRLDRAVNIPTAVFSDFLKYAFVLPRREIAIYTLPEPHFKQTHIRPQNTI